jgi:PDZ domain
MFVDPSQGNYQVQQNSPALQLGFKNFPMDQFGVQEPKLKAIAQTPELPVWGGVHPAASGRSQAPLKWLGITVRNVKDENEMSVYGLPCVVGVVVTEMDPANPFAKAGLQINDVILGVIGTDNIKSTSDLKTLDLPPSGSKLRVVRNQVNMDLEL